MLRPGNSGLLLHLFALLLIHWIRSGIFACRSLRLPAERSRRLGLEIDEWLLDAVSAFEPRILTAIRSVLP